MASATGTDAKHQAPALHRNNTSTTVDTGSDHSSPSPTSTSASSIDVPSPAHDKLTDGYGNSFEVPNYTIRDIQNAIPKHCYERSTAKGLYYVFRDLASVALTFYLFHTYLTPENVPSTPLRAVLWTVYTFIQGLFGLGLWVLGHECGHQNIATSKIVNDSVGWALHSILLTPYFSWKISHKKHHKVNGSIADDVVWNPRTRSEYASYMGKMIYDISELGEETPIVTFLWLIAQQTIGWPNHLLTNATGHNFRGKPNGLFGGVNHFNPDSPLFDPKDAKLILLSDLGLAIVIAALTYLQRTFGWANLLVWYFVPYLWVNHWLAAITFLQHTDPSIPRYNPESWTYTRGAAATIDRDFGFIGKHVFHGIIETHVLHHTVSNIPFYNADEASEAIRPVMGRHYRSEVKGGPVGFFQALWRNSRWCQWVEPLDSTRSGVLFFRNRNGLGARPMKMTPSST